MVSLACKQHAFCRSQAGTDVGGQGTVVVHAQAGFGAFQHQTKACVYLLDYYTCVIAA